MQSSTHFPKMQNQRIKFVDSRINRQIRLKNIVQGLFNFNAQTDRYGRASKVQAIIFDENGDLDGGAPSVDPVGWNWLSDEARKTNWVRFHILNQYLGGPGNNCANLIPATKASNNNRNWRGFEEAVKKKAKKHLITFEAEITGYHGFPPSPNNGFPKGINASAVYERDGKKKRIKTALDMNAPQSSDGISLTEEQRNLLHEIETESLNQRIWRLRTSRYH